MGLSLLDEIMKFDETKDNFKSDKRKKVGDYILGKILGEGTFAKVRLATHLITKEKVAIKIINKTAIKKHPYMKKFFRREAVLMQKLQHENIVGLYDVMETENSYYMVMEYADGGEFVKYLTSRRILTEDETRFFMRQLVSAVDHMHRTGIVHRDLKIDNILLDKHKNVKIIDFGLSNQAHSQAILTTQCGTPGYSAPEIFSKRNYGEAVDLWTLGVDMFVMLTGSLPFIVDPPVNLTKLHAQILRGVDIPQHLSDNCKDLLRRLLDPHEETRIKMPMVFMHPWINTAYSTAPSRIVPVNSLTLDEIDEDILSYMAEVLKIDDTDVRVNVMNRRVNGVTAIYQLLRRRVEKGLGCPGAEGFKRNSKLPAEQNMTVLASDSPPAVEESDDVSEVPMRHDVSVTIRFKMPVVETGGGHITDATERVWNKSYGNTSSNSISAKTLYETVKKGDPNVLMEKTPRKSWQKLTPRSAQAEAEKIEYKDFLRKLRVKSRESMNSPVTSKCTSHRSDAQSQASFDNSVSTALAGYLTSRSSTGSHVKPRESRVGVPARQGSLQRAGSTNVVSPVGDAKTMKQALTLSPIKPVSQTEHKQRAMEIMRKGDSVGRVGLPPPPPNSVMGGYIFDLGNTDDNGIEGEDDNECIACKHMEKLEKEFYGKFNLKLDSRSSAELSNMRHNSTCNGPSTMASFRAKPSGSPRTNRGVVPITFIGMRETWTPAPTSTTRRQAFTATHHVRRTPRERERMKSSKSVS
ncbi:5'-AMP-activated protein kinase catalytic subunit alpha-1-like [Lineus longissimus]|uniref:5'-AMP-activated protein kinase catalytic subunit alpha-1-like n=1 Tax=Lineus longissimus TaxID=88925 RepID=UPI002B4F9D6B